MDIKMKKSSICHILGKRSLMTTDIFLFDIGKARTEEEMNYELLEQIKNETAKNHRDLTCYGQYYDPLTMINNIPTFYADYADQVQVPDSEVCTQPKPSPTHCLTGWQEHQVWTQGSCTPTSW